MLDLVADVPYQKGSVRISEFYWPLSEPNQMLMNTNAQIFSGQPLNELQLTFFSLVVRKHGHMVEKNRTTHDANIAFKQRI